MNARCLLLGAALGFLPLVARADDWPQWRGPNRDAHAEGFKAPATWPKDLTKKWRVVVGDGVATPALVGDRLYVFSRQGGDEVTRCLDAASGKELWKDKYPAQGATGPAAGFSGPRSSPAVADGKVVTLGVRGTLSCLDAATGQKVWRHEAKGGLPRFFPSCSPLVADGLCVTQVGGEGGGAVAAYDLATGAEKWKWDGDGTAYASPTLLAADGVKAVVAETARNVVAVGLTDGKLLWKVPFAVQGRGYNAASPVVDGQTVLYAGSGRGARAIRVEKKGDGLAEKELWSNADNSVMFSTPVVKGGLVFGLSDRNSLFCVDTRTGKTAWSAPVKGGQGAGGRGGQGYGSIVDAGPVLLALTPAGRLIVFEPSAKEFKELASYKVADGGTYAYPVAAGNRVFVKDKDAVTLWTVE
jgi:outer membrane protein assembly factor BamB